MLILIDGESSVRKQTDMKHFLIIHMKNKGWYIMVYTADVTNYMFCFFLLNDRLHKIVSKKM